MEKLAKAGKDDASKTMLAAEPVAGLKRKQASGTARSPSLFDDQGDDELARSSTTRAERATRRYALESAKTSKRARLASDPDEPNTTTRGAAKAPPAPRKSYAAHVVSRASINSKFKQCKHARPAPAFKPSTGSPLATPQSAAAAAAATPTTQPKAVFKLLTSLLKANENRSTTVATQPSRAANPALESRAPKGDNNTPPPDPIYAEIEPFDFKLVKCYPGNEIEFHHSTDLKDNMKSFWSILRRQLQEWEVHRWRGMGVGTAAEVQESARQTRLCFQEASEAAHSVAQRRCRALCVQGLR